MCYLQQILRIKILRLFIIAVADLHLFTNIVASLCDERVAIVVRNSGLFLWHTAQIV